MDDARMATALTEITILERDIRFSFDVALSKEEKTRWQEAHRNAAGLKVALDRWIEMRTFRRERASA